MSKLRNFSTEWKEEIAQSDEIVQVTRTKWQEKNSAITGLGIVSGMTFNNLVAGQTYKISLYIFYDGNNSGAGSFSSRVLDNGVQMPNSVLIFTHTTNDQRVSQFFSRVFVAGGGQLQLDITDFASPTSITGRWQIEELPYHEQTTDWT